MRDVGCGGLSTGAGAAEVVQVNKDFTVAAVNQIGDHDGPNG